MHARPTSYVCSPICDQQCFMESSHFFIFYFLVESQLVIWLIILLFSASKFLISTLIFLCIGHFLCFWASTHAHFLFFVFIFLVLSAVKCIFIKKKNRTSSTLLCHIVEYQLKWQLYWKKSTEYIEDLWKLLIHIINGCSSICFPGLDFCELVFWYLNLM